MTGKFDYENKYKDLLELLEFAANIFKKEREGTMTRKQYHESIQCFCEAVDKEVASVKYSRSFKEDQFFGINRENPGGKLCSCDC